MGGSVRRLAPERLAAVRAAAQLLHRPAGPRDAAEIARAMAGVQAQDPYAARLSLRARSRMLRAADVDRARNEERSLVRAWAMRKTMHLLPADDAQWMLPLFEPIILAESQRRLAHFGVDAAAQERAVRAMTRALEAEGPLARDELVTRVRRAGVAVDDAVRIHLVRLLVARNAACLGPDRGSRSTLALARDWLGERAAWDREAALRELARRYLRAFAPATEVDFAGWAGLPLRDVRAGLAGIAAELTELRVGAQPMLALRGQPRRAPAGTLRLLPAFDTYLMGHRDASFMASESQWRRIAPGGGMLKAAIVRDGFAIGLWQPRRRGREIEVSLEPFATLPTAVRHAVDAELADIARFEGMPLRHRR